MRSVTSLLPVKVRLLPRYRMRQRQVFGKREEESEDSEHALLAELREAKKLEQEDESKEGLGGYDYNVLSGSLALRPLEFDIKESNNNVLSLMSSMDDEYDDIALVVEGTEGESEFVMPSGPISKAETPPVPVGGVLKSRYEGAWLWAMNKELKGLKDSGTFKVLDGLPEGERVEGESGGTWPYKEAVRGLMRLVVMSRPDITNAVRAVSRHSNSPAERHCKAVL